MDIDEDKKGKVKFLSKVCHNPRKRHNNLDIEQAKDVAKFLGTIFVEDPALRPTAETILDCLRDPKFLGKNSSGSSKRKDSAVSLSSGPVRHSTSKSSSPPRSKTTKTVSIDSKNGTIVVPKPSSTKPISLPDRKKSSNPAIKPNRDASTERTSTKQKEKKQSRGRADSSESSVARKRF